jgi:hypothetical protein
LNFLVERSHVRDQEKTEPIASAWMIFNKQMSPSNPVTNIAAFADFLLLKEII